jgi:ribulose-5-phosphate 4-epimerase/fuculose-1-phosphate aldolase
MLGAWRAKWGRSPSMPAVAGNQGRCAVGRLAGDSAVVSRSPLEARQVRDPIDRDVVHITASGSQLGALVPSDVVPVRFSRVSWGDGRASAESTIHRKVLAIPGAEASIHAHYLSAISVSFDAKEAENFLLYEGEVHGTEEFSFVPIDRTGVWTLGRVPSGTYLEPVSSKEMEARIPRYLADSRATLVKGHGPFVRGGSLEECLHLVGVVDASAKLLQAARLRGRIERAHPHPGSTTATGSATRW